MHDEVEAPDRSVDVKSTDCWAKALDHCADPQRTCCCTPAPHQLHCGWHSRNLEWPGVTCLRSEMPWVRRSSLLRGTLFHCTMMATTSEIGKARQVPQSKGGRMLRRSLCPKWMSHRASDASSTLRAPSLGDASQSHPRATIADRRVGPLCPCVTQRGPREAFAPPSNVSPTQMIRELSYSSRSLRRGVTHPNGGL